MLHTPRPRHRIGNQSVPGMFSRPQGFVEGIRLPSGLPRGQTCSRAQSRRYPHQSERHRPVGTGTASESTPRAPPLSSSGREIEMFSHMFMLK